MARPDRWLIPLLLAALAAHGGCLPKRNDVVAPFSAAAAPALSLTQIEYPDVEYPVHQDQMEPEKPRTIRDLETLEYWDMPLEEAIKLALSNSRILRDLGGAVLRSPDGTATSLDPAIQETDPRFGVEGALSAFDAIFKNHTSGEDIDRRLNNQFFGQLGFLRGNQEISDTSITKRSATGSEMSLRQYVDQSKDNNPGNQFADGAWNVVYEGTARQPLLQGGGVEYNRIAGPGGAFNGIPGSAATPGTFNGVVIARIRTDISLADFEIALRDYVCNIENAYWDLYFAYRDLDARVRARDGALETWRRIHALFEAGRRGGEAEREAQAREQYFRFEAELQDSLAGRPLDGTRTNNGSRPGTFRALPGVLVNERRLRLLMNLPANGGRLIRPANEPPIAPIVFDWSQVSSEAIARRAELRRQRWQVKRRELELLASRNLLLPQLDIVSTYRFRGFGDNLLNPNPNTPPFNNAYGDLLSGNFQEWQNGVEFSMPLGFRQAHAGVRNCELRLSRERVLLEAQEREVMNDVSSAIAEMDRAFLVMQTNYNRWVAARHQLGAVQAAYADDRVDFLTVLDAQRRYAEAESQNYRSRVEHAVAVKNVHFEKGSLLDYLGIVHAEGPWPDKAYDDADRREASRGPVNWRPKGFVPWVTN